MAAQHHPVLETNLSPQADENSSSAPLAESVYPPTPMLKDDSAHSDERPARLDESHRSPRKSIHEEIEEIAATASAGGFIPTSEIPSDGAHSRPRRSHLIGIEEDSVEATAGKADIPVVPIDIAEPEGTGHRKGKSTDEKGPSSIEGLLQQQIGLMSDVQFLLREINTRQAAADVSRQALQSVSAHSSSAWNPLLKSTRERIDAIVDRWRGSLDVLLVFVGLFTAIVTSFFVDSVDNLGPDQAARTNELLANLTEIIIQLNNSPSAHLSINLPVPFVPDASDIRVNAYWSLALIISISAAALAVAGRAFLAVLTKSTGKPHVMLIDIHQRWEAAENILGPALETLPVILTIPVILFLIGLLDNIFSAAIGSPHAFVPIIVAASLSATAIFFVGLALFCAMIHAYVHPETSPFRTTFSRYIYALGQCIKKQMHSSVKRISVLGRKLRYRAQSSALHPWKSDVESQSPKTEHEKDAKEEEDRNKEGEGEKEEEPTLEQYMANDRYLPHADCVYHATLQATHDNDLLDQAAAAFPSICENRTTRYNLITKVPSASRTVLSDLETKSLVHLLSPEASYRCNLTASESILRLNSWREPYSSVLFCGTSQRLELLDALRDAAQREHIRFKGVDYLWRSTFIQSFAVLSHRRRRIDDLLNDQPDISRIVNMLNSKYIEKTEGHMKIIGQRVTEMAFSVLSDDAFHGRSSDWSAVFKNGDIFGHYLANLLDREPYVTPLTLIKCFSRWTGRSMFSDIAIDWIPSLVSRIWDSRTLTVKDVLMFVSWGVRSGLCIKDTPWMTVLQDLLDVMETQRRPIWSDIDTFASPGQNDGHPLLEGMIPCLGACNFREYEHFWSPDLDMTMPTLAFSAIFEMLSWQLNTSLTENSVDPLRVDQALLHIIGPSPSNSFPRVDVAACLACWDGTNIFTRRMTAFLKIEFFPGFSYSKLESTLSESRKRSRSQKILVDAMVRWLWKDVPGSDILDHVNRLANIRHMHSALAQWHLTDVLMSLIHFKIRQTRRLDLAFSVLNSLRTNLDTYCFDVLSFMAGLIDFIHTYTHDTHETLSREQAKMFASLYDQFCTLSLVNLGGYSCRRDQYEVTRTKILELLQTSWNDLYPRGSIGPEGQLLLEPDHL